MYSVQPFVLIIMHSNFHFYFNEQSNELTLKSNNKGVILKCKMVTILTTHLTFYQVSNN
jgi:hypothetical protein